MVRPYIWWAAASLLLVNTSAVAQLRIIGLDPQSPYCGHRSVADPMATESVETFTLAGSDVPQIHWITAGDTVAIRLPASPLAGLKASVYVKPFGIWSFQTVCLDVPLRAHVEDVELRAVRPGQADGSVWRIELSATASGGDPIDPPSLSLLRHALRSIETDNSQVPGALSDASGLLCIKDERPPAHERRSSGFAGKVRLDVTLADSDLTISDPARQRIAGLLLIAGSLWTQACVECQVQQLTVITIDGHLFVRRGFAEWYQKSIATNDQSLGEQSLGSLEASLTYALEPIQWLIAGDSQPPAPRSKAFSDYVAFGISETAPLCTTGIAYASAPTLAEIQAALCTRPLAHLSRRARMSIRFSAGHTACGNSQNIIGCRADSELTEYNVRDYQFTFDAADGNIPPVGEGLVPVSLLQVIVHEMGHWIGLPHLQGSATIMASSLELSRCIDSLTISALSELERDPRRETRAKVPAPFTYRRITRRAAPLTQ